MLAVRPAAPQDIPAILTIQERVFGEIPWQEDDFRRILGAPGQMVLVAESSEILGFVALRVIADEAEILNLAVKPNSQRRGVGRAMIRDACHRLERAGVREIFLEVRPSNEPALGLYYSHGFTLRSVRKDYYSKPREDAYVLSRVLVHPQHPSKP